MFSYLYAQSGSSPAGGGSMQILMMVAIFAIFYFLLIRPQAKKAKELEKKRQEVKKGDKVITGGGVLGKVTQVKDKDNMVVVEIAKDIRVEVVRSTLMNVIPKE